MKKLLLVMVSLISIGCTSTQPRQVDWGKAYKVTSGAVEVVQIWESVLEDESLTKELSKVRALSRPVILAIKAKADDDTAPDPTTRIKDWLTVITYTAQNWPDVRQRNIGLATISSIRLGLIMADVEIDDETINDTDTP